LETFECGICGDSPATWYEQFDSFLCDECLEETEDETRDLVDSLLEDK
jgi:hypothetical protein